MMHLIHNRLSTFLLGLDRLDPEDLSDAFANEAIECGGTYVPPKKSDSWSSHLFEISLHCVSATGANEAEAIHNWRRVAHKRLEQIVEDDGFITVYPPGAAA